MANTDDVLRLAALARIEVGPEELETRAKEFEQILKYVSQLETLKIAKGDKPIPALRNIFREDGEPDAAGIWTEKLAKQFPERKDNALSVRQVITHEQDK